MLGNRRPRAKPLSSEASDPTISHVDRLRALRAESKDKVYFSALHQAQNKRLFTQQTEERRAARLQADAEAKENLRRREKGAKAKPEAAGDAPAPAAAAASSPAPEPPKPDKPEEDVAAVRGDLRREAEQERVHGLSVRLLPFDVVQEQIATILVERWLLRDFILHVPFLTIFMIFFIGRRRFAEEFFAIDAAYKSLAVEPLPPTHPFTGEQNRYPYFQKPFEEIGNEEDWYDFLEAIAVPKLFATVPRSGIPPQDITIFSGNVVPIGAYRVRFKHVRDRTCTPNEAWYPANESWFPRECYGEYEDSREQRNAYALEPGAKVYHWQECDSSVLRITGRFSSYDCGGYIIEIPVDTNATAAYQLVNEARKARLAKTLTLRFASLDFIAYSTSASAFLYVRLAIEVTPGGGFMPWNHIRTFRGGGQPGWVVVDILFGLMVIFAIYRLIEDFRKHYELTKKRASYFADAWNILSILNTIFFSISLVMHYTWLGLSLATGPVFGPERSEEDLRTYPTRLAQLEEFSKLTLYFNSINAVLSTIVLLKFARTNQRLNILQRTVAGSIGHLLSVLIIFGLIVVAYGVAGNMLFGRMLREYRTVTEAIVSNFRSLMGDFKYWDLFLTNRFLAFLYFWSFVILGLFIMLNFIVAILMRGFEEEANKTRRVELTKSLQKALATSHNTWANLKITLLNIFRGRETPESMLFTGMKSMAAEFNERGEVDFSQIFISRDDFTGAIPPVDVALYGDEYFDELWLRFLNELDMRRRAKSDKTLSQVSAQVYENARDAAVDVLYRYHAQIYGIAEKVENHVIEAVKAERAIARQMRRLKEPPSWELIEEADAARAAFDSEEQRRNMHTFYSARCAMGNKSWPYTLGSDLNKRPIRARSIADIVGDLERRCEELFHVFPDCVPYDRFMREQEAAAATRGSNPGGAPDEHFPIWPEARGTLRDVRVLLNDVLADIHAFKQTPLYDKWLSGDVVFSPPHAFHELETPEGPGVDDDDGYDFDETTEPPRSFDRHGARSFRAGSGRRGSRYQPVADDDSGWQAAAPYGGGR
uniref:Polycystin cation channel PKD1/PKD2 domain-containing protein n=2 Tax=Neobodo designis TaxID=312471 RepID=A0A7S1PUN9_NEODS|mmetsp:Transcript_20273/g.62997  ORF Transcript_20273/g.62997 Transcript_20273/m.62997 type:complete len:1050 (+) Transcript_20273:84-3233(+)